MNFSRVAPLLLAACSLTTPQVHATSFPGLGDLAGGSSYSDPRGVSDDGSVVAGLSNSASGGEAFRWTEGGMVGLGDLPGGIFGSNAQGVSGDGSVVVGSSDSGAPGREAYRWTSVSGMAGLGYLPGGLSESIARDASFDGSVIVGQSHSGSGTQAFRWTSGGMVGLGDLVGGSFSDAYATFGDGSIIVGASKSTSGMEAFRWTAGGGMIGLGDPPSGNFYSIAEWMSGDGSVVVGFSHTADTGFEAFIWDTKDLIRTLVDILTWPVDVFIWVVLG